jgi:hypothetical protein
METSTSTGTGNFTLAGAVVGYQSFTSAFGTNTAYYIIANIDVPAQWEVGSFTVNGTTLQRVAANVLAGSAGAGALVNFSAGTKNVFNAPPASALLAWNAGMTGLTGTTTTVSGYGAYPSVSAVTLTVTAEAVSISGTTACDCL